MRVILGSPLEAFSKIRAGGSSSKALNLVKASLRRKLSPITSLNAVVSKIVNC